MSRPEAGPLSEWRLRLLQPHRGLDAQGRASSTFQRVPEGLTARTLHEPTVGSAESSRQLLPGSENPGPRAGLLVIAREWGLELQRVLSHPEQGGPRVALNWHSLGGLSGPLHLHGAPRATGPSKQTPAGFSSRRTEKAGPKFGCPGEPGSLMVDGTD